MGLVEVDAQREVEPVTQPLLVSVALEEELAHCDSRLVAEAHGVAEEEAPPVSVAGPVAEPPRPAAARELDDGLPDGEGEDRVVGVAVAQPEAERLLQPLRDASPLRVALPQPLLLGVPSLFCEPLLLGVRSSVSDAEAQPDEVGVAGPLCVAPPPPPREGEDEALMDEQLEAELEAAAVDEVQGLAEELLLPRSVAVGAGERELVPEADGQSVAALLRLAVVVGRGLPEGRELADMQWVMEGDGVLLALRQDVALALEDRSEEWDAEGQADEMPLRLGVEVGQGLPLCAALTDPLRVAEGDVLALPLRQEEELELGLGGGKGEVEAQGVAPPLRLGVEEAQELPLCEVLTVPLREALGEDVPLALRQAVGLPLGLREADKDADAQVLAKPLRLGVEEAQGLPHWVALTQPLREGLGEDVPLALRQAVGLPLGLRNGDRDADAQPLSTLLRLCVDEAHGLPLWEVLPVPLREMLGEAVPLALRHPEALPLGLRELDKEAEAQPVATLLLLGVDDAQGQPVLEGLTVPLREAVGEAVPLALRQAVGLPLGHREADKDADAQAVATPLRLCVEDAQGLPLWETLTVPLRVALGEDVPLALRQAVVVPLGQAVDEALTEVQRDGGALRVGEAEEQGLGVSVLEPQPLREMKGEGVPLGLLHAVGLPL